MKEFIRQRLFEGLNTNTSFYHGTRSKFPFEAFNQRFDGSGIVNSGGKKFGGLFFTSEFENAEFYTEWFVAEVAISKYKEVGSGNHPPTIMKSAIENKQSYIIRDIHDGAMMSDIVVVPFSRVQDVSIIKWIFVGDKDSYFASLDEMFFSDPEDENRSQDLIASLIAMMGMDLEFLLKIPIFNEYFQSKDDN